MQEHMTAEQLRKAKRPNLRRGPGRGRRPDNKEMNGLERAYAKHLDLLKSTGEIWGYAFHAMTLTIAEPPKKKNARWTPDFCVWTADMVLEFHDTKGHMEDHALVRIKAAAEKYPHPIFVITRIPKKSGGGWKREEF